MWTSLAVFFVVLTLFLLDRDDGRFGLDFTLAAFSTGLAAGTKVIGLFFVLTIPTYLLVGIVSKKLTLQTAISERHPVRRHHGGNNCDFQSVPVVGRPASGNDQDPHAAVPLHV